MKKDPWIRVDQGMIMLVVLLGAPSEIVWSSCFAGDELQTASSLSQVQDQVTNLMKLLVSSLLEGVGVNLMVGDVVLDQIMGEGVDVLGLIEVVDLLVGEIVVVDILVGEIVVVNLLVVDFLVGVVDQLVEEVVVTVVLYD